METGKHGDTRRLSEFGKGGCDILYSKSTHCRSVCGSSLVTAMKTMEQAMNKYDESSKLLSEIQKQQAQLSIVLSEMGKTTERIEQRVASLEDRAIKHLESNQDSFRIQQGNVDLGRMPILKYFSSKIGLPKSATYSDEADNNSLKVFHESVVNITSDANDSNSTTRKSSKV